MRCKKCSTNWKLSGSDDGPLGKAAPGHFMIVVGILFAISLVLGLGFKSWGGLAFGLMTLFFLAMAIVGCGHKEKVGTYQGSTCPDCGDENRILPWHF